VLACLSQLLSPFSVSLACRLVRFLPPAQPSYAASKQSSSSNPTSFFHSVLHFPQSSGIQHNHSPIPRPPSPRPSFMNAASALSDCEGDCFRILCRGPVSSRPRYLDCFFSPFARAAHCGASVYFVISYHSDEISVGGTSSPFSFGVVTLFPP